MTLGELEEAVRPYLTEKRYSHTLRCRDMALRLADKWGCDRDKTARAALLHDITKKLSDGEQLKLCEKCGIIHKYSEGDFSFLIHADTAACLAREVFGESAEVCSAIKSHTLGGESMTLLDKIIYLADAIEAGRDYPGVDEIRSMAFEDIDRAVLMSLESTLEHVRASGREPNEQSVKAAESLRRLISKGEISMEANKNLTPDELLEAIVKTADSRKARDIVAIHVTEQTTLADYFVIMTGTSTTHIRALSDEIELKLKENYGLYAHHIEGITSNWILMDYVTVVVNIFMSDSREMYALERMWGDSAPVDLSKYITDGE